MKTQRRLLVSLLILLALVPLSVAAESPSGFEKPPILAAQALAPASLLSGDGFHVDDQVPTDGLSAHFTIRSDVGTFQANSLEMLRIRIAEIPAIMELTKTSKTGVFAQSLATNAARPVEAAGQMIMHPVDTVTGLPSGVGRFFGRVGLGAQKLAESATEPEGASGSEKAGQFATTTGQATRDVLGYEQERRELAKRLHVDPYTTNPILSKQLDDFALVAFRAHVGVTISMSVFIPGSMAITATRVVSTWVWDTPKADLIVQNQNRLKQLGVSDTEIRAFMRNPVFPLSVQTAFLANLERLPGVPGRKDAVMLASTAESEEQARFLTDAVGMLARYHETETPIAKIIVRRAIVGEDRNGAIVGEAPVDYVSWTEQVAYFASRPDLQKRQRTIWLTGQFSPLARKNFEALGWVIHEKTNPIPESSNGQ
jgi:hypothetical protein